MAMYDEVLSDLDELEMDVEAEAQDEAEFDLSDATVAWARGWCRSSK